MFNSFLGMGASTAVDESAVLEEMRHTPLIECVNDPLDACIRITYESTVNFNNITKALAMDELKYFQENGVEMVYEAGKVVEFFTQAKQWIMNAWSKVMGIFKNVIESIDGLTAFAWYHKNKGDVDKLPNTVVISDIINKLPNDTKYPNAPMVYDYHTYTQDVERELVKKLDTLMKKTGLKIGLDDYSDINKIISVLKNSDSAEAAKKAARVSSKEFKDEFYKEICNINVNGFEEFSKKCINLFRSDERHELKSVNKTACVNVISNSAKTKQKLKDLYKNTENQYKKMIKNIEDARKAAEKAGKDNKEADYSAALGIMRYGVSAIRDAVSVSNSLLRAHISAIRSEVGSAQAQLAYAIAITKIAEKKPGNDNNEEVQHNSAVTTESFLASLKMI